MSILKTDHLLRRFVQDQTCFQNPGKLFTSGHEGKIPGVQTEKHFPRPEFTTIGQGQIPLGRHPQSLRAISTSRSQRYKTTRTVHK
ncbi:hypothetical protein E5288_WYG010253 [Bos mutus]|uniref:Uncharacterized protein n=1 Tax=Bos mutus TaxID=72004 RepID=A0A6B0R740_9CETA|nr:hypothetical protein [Bos mutus]